jgi:hypothetical protein
LIDGIPLCLSCHTDYQNVSSNNVSSAFQLHRGHQVADSMFKVKDGLLRNQHTERQIKNERNIEVNNYNMHDNNIVYGNNSGILNTGKAQIKNNDIGITDLSKSSGNNNISQGANIKTSGLKKMAKLCLQILKRFFWWKFGN